MSTYTQIYLHVIFSVKGRAPLIQPEWEEKLHKYITGIITNKGQKLIAINGMPDHIHLLIGIKPSCCISDLIREIKKSSNEYIKGMKFSKYDFRWQDGYGVFSCGHSSLNRVISYIINQKNHHKKVSSMDEYRKILERLRIEYNLNYTE